MSRVVIIGGGAAGMMAAIAAAENGHQVTVFEKNEKTGKKLYITGKGRCNLTNAGDREDLFRNVISNPRFLYSAFSAFDSADVMRYFESLGLAIKVERGNRVFPVSDHSSDVIACLVREMKRRNVEVRLNTEVMSVEAKDGVFSHLVLAGGKMVHADACIVATGGLSYPSTGSTGDGFRFAKALGHTVTDCYPSLVAVRLKEDYIRELEGISLKNIELRMKEESAKKDIYSGFGEMLFTRNGISGPVALSASSYVGPLLAKNKQLIFILDLKPALTIEQLNARILRDFDEFKNRQYKNALDHLLPQRLISVIIKLSGIDPEKKVNLITKEERQRIVQLLKGMTFRVDGLGEFREAIITKGGVKVKEIDPQTMESKLVKGVYFAGEVLDLDAMTGGYNLQIAWSTARAAGKAIE
ncbi:MAG: NAD(P)/FAD-dependent oxidoreductase [Lachnospiraceae bacterium]|nr:NAD(P)/FAD-dependent oxidoreductase [Lachnospiraceae bacterium]